MEMTTWIAVIGVAAVVVIAWQTLRNSRRREVHAELKEQVQTWEDEGGNVPEVPTVSPEPADRTRV